MGASTQVLLPLRLTAIMRALQDNREMPGALVWSQRIPDVNATDGEIMARLVGRVQIADLIADDQRAVAYRMHKMTFESTPVPNIKHGYQLTQEELNQLYALMNGGRVGADETGMFSDRENYIIDALRLGILHRKEALFVAMLTDGLSYDRLGIKMTNVTWGMPSDLKVTLTGTAKWDAPTTAVPVTDILAMIRLGSVRYGVTFDRITMSLAAFNYMTATTEFINRAKLFLPTGIATTAMPFTNTMAMKELAQRTLGVAEIEIYDARYWSQADDGTYASAPFLPINKVVFTARANDGDRSVWNFANGVVTESIVNGMTDAGINGAFNGPTRGPVVYTTGGHNPPNMTYWGVARGFPRKFLLQSSAVLTVGTFTDPIAVGEPF